MSSIRNQEDIEEMRRRLYERGMPTRPTERGHLSDITPVVPKAWADVPTTPPPMAPVPTTIPPVPKPRRLYRSIALLGTLAVFLLVLGITGLYMFLGNNQISNKNIFLTTSGPLTIGGGEELPLELTIENKNTVAIESAVLIINYPSGTKSVGENPRDLLEDRIQVGTVNAGEVLKIPTKAIVFGEENQELQINATIEYRLVDSNGTFYKNADPFNFTIISSPVVIRVETLKKVSAGQEIDVKLTVQSNSATPLKDILVTADWPGNFDYGSATPAPVFRESAWLIEELLPERSSTITIKGLIVGQSTEEFQMKFTAGTPKPDNQFEIGSVLATAASDFEIEQPFIDVGMTINSERGDIVTLATGDSSRIEVEVRNTLTDTLYDMTVEVGVSGNVLVRDRVVVSQGVYDSVKDVIRFDPSGNEALKEISPGETVKLSFSLQPGERLETPAFTLTANAFARRVFENRATEQLVGTAKRDVRFTSRVTLNREVGRSTAGMVDTGPIPPVADQATTYTITLIAAAGGNNLSGATVAGSLPQYVNWSDQVRGEGTIVFNPVSKEFSWNIGDIEANKEKQISFQVTITPSQNQVGSTPALIGAQRFRATDRFTGEVVRADASSASTELSTEAGFPENNGVVVAQ